MNAQEFHVLEYSALRTEILASQSRRTEYEKYGAGLIAALYAWLSSAEAGSVQLLNVVGWWVAPIIALGVGWRSNSLSKGVRRAGAYLIAIEAELTKDATGPKGWHRCLGAARSYKKNPGAGIPDGFDEDFIRMLATGLDKEKNNTEYTWYIIAAITGCLAVFATLNL